MTYPLKSASEIQYINLTLFTEKEIMLFNKVTLISLIRKSQYPFYIGDDTNEVQINVGDDNNVPAEFYKRMKNMWRDKTDWRGKATDKQILQSHLNAKRQAQINKSIYYNIDAKNHSEYEHMAEELNDLETQYQELDEELIGERERQSYSGCTLNHTTDINIENNILPNHIQTSLLINTELTCIVCLNDLDNENVAITKCGHHYCKDCLGITLSLDKARQKCGQCRTEFR